MKQRDADPVKATDSFPELGTTISSYEQRFERFRRRSGFFLAPIAFLVLWHLPAPGLSQEAHRLLAVFGLVVTLWITEAIPLAVTALLGPSLCVLCGVAQEKEVFKSFGNPILFLFMGSYYHISPRLAAHTI